MKENMEFEREDLCVDRDIQIDGQNGQQIVAYLETLFDVNKKFNLQLDSNAGEWVNIKSAREIKLVDRTATCQVVRC